MNSTSQLPEGRVTITLAALCLMVGVFWAFPKIWYTKRPAQADFLWLVEQPNVPGWTFTNYPVSEAAEAELGADAFVNGAFTQSGGSAVRVFSAKRFSETENEVDMFAHNPDRCWPLVGWKLQLPSPEVVLVEMHGRQILFERRVFLAGNKHELVYFGALVGGQPLPYRLDQYLAFGQRVGSEGARDRSGTLARAADPRFWNWIWNSFKSRQPLRGAKHFIRVSTESSGAESMSADLVLTQILKDWLQPGDLESDARAAAQQPGHRSDSDRVKKAGKQ